MKTVATFFWILNALLAGYLGVTLKDTDTFQSKDYQGVERGIALMDSLRFIIKAGNQKDFDKMYKNTYEEGNRSIDVMYLKKANQIMNVYDSIDKQMIFFEKVNHHNYLKINDLIKSYERFLLFSDTTIEKSIISHFEPVYQYNRSEKSHFQKLQIANLQNYIQRLEVNATKKMFGKVGETCGLRTHKILALPLPMSNIVEEGQTYEASLILFETYSFYKYNYIKKLKINNNLDLGRTLWGKSYELSLPPMQINLTKTEKVKKNGAWKLP